MRLCSLLLLICACVCSNAQAQHRPYGEWKQLETEHFRVVFEAGLDSIAQHAARRAEAAYARLTSLSPPPKGKTDIILGDNLDMVNGAATPIPGNRIYLWARPPADDLVLNYYNDWMDLVIVHELTHIFHLDRTGKAGRALRTVFGRVPWGWPIFPIIGTPDWTLEGLATYIESAYTGTGRVHGSAHEMIIRTAILENDFDPIDRVSGSTPMWPGGQRVYIYGSMFMDYIAKRIGPEAHREILNKTAGSVLPPPLVMNRIARRATGMTFTALYDEWQRDLRRRYTTLADSLRALGLTKGEHVAGGERNVYHPRISPDGKRLAYVEENGRATSATVVLDLATGSAERTRRNGLAPAAWANNHTLLTTQYDRVDPYTIHSDIYTQVNGGQQRVTKSARYEAVDVDRSGRKLVVVSNARGMTSLVQRDTHTGAERIITGPRPDAQWVLPRWSPDGSMIAAQRWRLGGTHEIVVLDTMGTVISNTSDAGAVSGQPAWSPDGKYIVYSSDRTGISNLYAIRSADAGTPLQITNVLSGAFYPDVSPDGKWIYYSAYHSNGFRIERIPFDTATFRSVGRVPAAEVAIVPQTGPSAHVTEYSALRSALPKFWVPAFVGDSTRGTFLGAATLGWDDLNRHSYFISVLFNFANGRTMGALNYAYAGLGNPVLNFDATREWEVIGEQLQRREDRLALTASFRHPRWRSSLAGFAGVEGVGIRRDESPLILETRDRLFGVIAGVGFANTRRPAYAISAEDGMRGALTGRRRFDIEPGARDASYSELNGTSAAYKSISAFGFAHHVIAARASGAYRTGLGVGPTDVGGVNNALPVRGFEDSDRIGFSAWSASAEYRLPIAMIGRGVRLWPLFIDRIAGSIFVDAGNASCDAEQRLVYRFCAGNTNRSDEMLLSAGAEVGAGVAFIAFVPSWVRVGVAKPLQGPRTRPTFYFTFGESF